jgi:antitoxin component YwqK of YwqJK toxin-antitoxin module
MKNHIIISLLFLSVGLSQQEYNLNDLIEMDNGLWTVKFSDEPITGKVYGYFGDVKPYKKVYMGNLLNGKKEGKWVGYYHSTGKKSIEYNYKDGKEDGLQTSWYENGQKKVEGTYKDGKEDGLYTDWYENGKMKMKGTLKGGKKDGLFTEWYENGQKSYDGTFKDGEKDGLTTQWYENGQKGFEGTYKNGELIDVRLWNKDGSVME